MNDQNKKKLSQDKLNGYDQDKEELIRRIRLLEQENQLLKTLLNDKDDRSRDILALIGKSIALQEKSPSHKEMLEEFKSVLNYFEYEVLRQLEEKEKALVRKSTNLRAVIESTNIGIALLDEDGLLLECNGIFSNYFQKIFQQEIKFYAPLLDLLQHTKWYARWEKLLAERQLRKAAHFVETFITSEGRQVLLEIKAFPIFHNQLFKGASVFVEDISQQHYEQEQLRLLNSAVVNAQDAIAITALSYQDSGKAGVVYVNKAFSELSGYQEDEILGKTLKLLYGPETSAEELERIRNALAAGEAVSSEIIHYHKDGSKHWVNCSSVPLRDEQNRITHWISVQRDISEKREAENTIRQSKQLLESINRNIKEAIIRADADQQLAYTNRAFREMFGYTEDEKPLLKQLFATPDMFRLFKAALEEEGVVSNFSYLFRRSNGSTFWGLSSFLKTEFHGISFLDGAIRDITDRKEAERILKEKNIALEKTNEELDRFVYSASHDLRAPLASTLGLINISRITNNEQERFSYLEMMEQSLNKMDKIIQDITDYSRNARLEIETEEIHFEPLINDVLQRLKYLQKIDEVEINIKVEGACKFFTDKIRLYVILINLLSNAIKYHRFKDNSPYVDIRVSVGQDTASIIVEDNGIGIEEKHMDKIFGMFFQAARESSGSGLGLYIVKETINKLGGQIWVRSIYHSGTSFEVELPNGAASHQQK
ncbi:MAG: PAS domain S-box protein [Cyclobacteriaceae bacterium]